MISICLPTFNRGHLLPEVIESVINQSYKDWQLVIVDDGSSDDSRDILEHYKKYNIKVIFTDHKGISSARKTAYEASKGEFIKVLDSDTPMHPEYLKKCLPYLEENDIVYTGAQAVYNSQIIGNFMPEDINKVIKDPKEILKPNQIVPNYTVLAKRKCFENAYRVDFTVNDDLWTIYQWVKRGYKFKLLKEYLMFHISDHQNVSTLQKELVEKITKQIQQEEK